LNYLRAGFVRGLLCVLGVCATTVTAFGQMQPIVSGARDTSMNKTNTTAWKNETVRVYYEKLNSLKVYTPDTSIHTFHRRPFIQPWKRDLGNLGSPVYDLMFTPEYRVGPSLGYHVYDAYKFFVDSLSYYNTTRPYSVFTFNLGSKLEQTASLLHTQNINANWNFAFEYRKTTSPGFYMIQRNNHDNAALTSNYKSPGKHYTIHGAAVYNIEQHDENGGIRNDSDLNNPDFLDRKTIHTLFQSDQFSSKRSSVTNVLRDLTLLVQQTYTFGKTDTLYNEDSTRYSLNLTPRFSITHKLEGSTEKHTYNDLTPDSMRYIRWFNQSFPNTGQGYYTNNGGDSVFNVQQWLWLDNKLLLNGYIGNQEKQLRFSAGAGNRLDRFINSPLATLMRDSLPKQVYAIGRDRNDIVSNYLEGQVKKESLRPGEWGYNAQGQLFVTGQYAGNLVLNAAIGKDFCQVPLSFVAGFNQQIGSAPYNYTLLGNRYVRLNYSFSNEVVNMVYATVASQKLQLSGGFRNYVIGNFIYINEKERPAQYTTPFTVSQAWLNKVFRVGSFYLDNELVVQQKLADAPVNIPLFMGRAQLSFEHGLFKNAMKLATGIQVQYNTPYAPAGYSAVLNRFFYQTYRTIENRPEAAVFINMKVKRFRAFLMVDQLQQILYTNTILFTGSPYMTRTDPAVVYTPVYAAPDLAIRFGFNWVLLN
jgi:hypothetical protein